MTEQKIIGPFSQVITMRNLKMKGPINDSNLEIIIDGGILCIGGKIQSVGSFESLIRNHPDVEVHKVDSPQVALPGFIDSHTHICFAGNRAMDFAARNAGVSYQEIAAAGGGIWNSVNHTRAASQAELEALMKPRIERLMRSGITTVEVKSGYGLSYEHELKMLRAINNSNETSPIDIIATCLAAHIVPKDFEGGEEAYLQMVLNDLVPTIQDEELCNRFDIFLEENAYTKNGSSVYLSSLKKLGFDITVHGDQFTVGGSAVAIEVGAVSVDHLEVSGDTEIQNLGKSDIVATALPGASLGIGCQFTPARRLLDAGCCLAIASDWNPGSAPMGDLLTQASILAAFQKLSTAEVFAGITFRAAKALNIYDRGVLETGKMADFISFPTGDYRDILYSQGAMKPTSVWKSAHSL